MFGQPAATSSSGFGSSTGGLFGSSTQTPSTGGLFGGSSGSTTFGQPSTPAKSPFQSSTTTGSTGLFGSTTANTNPASGGTGLFGSTGQSTTGGLFGSSNTTSTGGGLFGSSAPASSSGLFGSGTTGTTGTTGGGGLFGSSTTGASTGLFGSNANVKPAGTGLFGSSGATSGGGLFGSTGSTNVFGGAPTSAFGVGAAAAQQGSATQRFSGAVPLLTYAEATDLRFGNIPNGLASDQNACVANGIIPEPLRTQFLEQEARMSDQEYKLSDVSSESTDEFNKLLRLTAKMDQAVSHLRSLIDQQREAVQFLVFEAKGCGRVAEKALHEARRLNNASNLHMINKPIPSDFFWKLVQSLEVRIAEYQAKSRELHQVLFGEDGVSNENAAHANNRRGESKAQKTLAIHNILETLRQQHQGFKVVASQVALTHEKMNALREQYNDWIVLMTGQPPKDFQQEDNAEKERRQRLLRKVEESAQAISISGNKPGSQGNTTSSVFGNTGQQGSSTTGGLFGTSSSAPSNTGGLFGSSSSTTSNTGGLFGSSSQTSNTNASTGLFGSSQSSSTPSTGLFGTSTNTTTQGTGLFGGGTNASTAGQSPSMFGGSSLTAAPRKNKTKRSSSKYR